jgi:hypothetical protein
MALPFIFTNNMQISPTELQNLSRKKNTDTVRDIQTPTKFVFLNINKVLPNQINSPLTRVLQFHIFFARRPEQIVS